MTTNVYLPALSLMTSIVFPCRIEPALCHKVPPLGSESHSFCAS